MPRTAMSSRSRRWTAALLGLSRRSKRAVMLSADAVAIPLLMYLARSLKGDSWETLSLETAWSMFIATIVSIPIFARIGLYRAVIRYMGPRAALVVAAGAAAAVLLLMALTLANDIPGVRLSTIVIFGSLLTAYVGTSRMLLRWLMLANGRGAPRVIIYGAGAGGAELGATLSNSSEFEPVAFVDDNPALWGTNIAGRAVHPATSLAHLVESTGSRRVLLAMPSLSSRRRREILAQLEPLGVHVQTMPGISDLVSGAARIDEVQ
jgi:FlaA1/EpsC-like NDP-sugar epimerase